MLDAKIDQAVLAVTETSWKKVVLVIARAAEQVEEDLPDGDIGYEMVAKRIEALVNNGQLKIQGEAKKWRHSEVRLP